VVIAPRLEMRAVGREQRECVRDVAAMHCEMVARLVIGRGRSGAKVEPSDIEDIVLPEQVDRVGSEDVGGQGSVIDLKRGFGLARIAQEL